MRLNFIDNAKAIAILLVIIGHTGGIPKSFENLIYSFHIPAFFFLSGYLIKDYKLAYTFKKYFQFQLKSLIIPYLFFGTVSLLYSMLNNFMKGDHFNIYSKLAGFFYGNSEGLDINIVLWFFTCLFVTSVLFYLLSKIMKVRNIVIVSLLTSYLVLIIFGKHLQVRPPWNMDLSLIALFFYATGKYISNKSIVSSSIINSKIRIAALIILSFLLYYLSNMNGRVDMAFMVFNNPILFLVNACMGIAILLLLGLSLPITKASLYLSRNTIVIFPLHPIFFSIFTGLGMIVFKLPHTFQDNLLFSGLYTGCAIVLCYPISLFLFRFIPIAVGGRRK